MISNNFKQWAAALLIAGLLSALVVLGSFADAHARAEDNRILLPIIQSIYSPPTTNIEIPEVTAASDDLGCVNYAFEYKIDGVWRTWNGNWHIGRGASGPIVKLLQWHLVYTHGQTIGNYGPHGDGVDGDYGSQTASAVRNVQSNFRQYGFQACGRQIAVDGMVGPQTWTLIFSNK